MLSGTYTTGTRLWDMHKSGGGHGIRVPGMESGSSSRNVGNSSSSSSSSSSSNDGRGSDVAEYDDSGDGGGYDESYYSMPPWEKGAIAGAYFSLIAALVLAMVRLLLHPPHTPSPACAHSPPQPSTAPPTPPRAVLCPT